MTGCSTIRPIEDPIPVRTLTIGTAPAEIALIFLPGRGDRMDAFVEHGLLADLEATGMAADIWLVDAHLGYYRSRTLGDKLDASIMPHLANYREVWVVGISLGALGAVLLEADRPGRWDRMILLGPFVGNSQRFFSRSGVAAGTSDAIPDAAGPEHLRLFWNWIIQHAHSDSPGPKLWVAWGESDRFAPHQDNLRHYLPAENILTLPGGHDWITWRTAWQQLLPAITAENK